MQIKNYPFMGKIYEEVTKRFDPFVKCNGYYCLYLPQLTGSVKSSITTTKSGRSVITWRLLFEDDDHRILVQKKKKTYNEFHIVVINKHTGFAGDCPLKVFLLFKEFMRIFDEADYNFVQLSHGYITKRNTSGRKLLSASA